MRQRALVAVIVLAASSACGGGDDRSGAAVAEQLPIETSPVTTQSAESEPPAPTAPPVQIGSEDSATTTVVASDDDGVVAESGGGVGSGCRVTRDDVEAVVGQTVSDNDTPDAWRCNFTWDNGGPWGIDVGVLAGRREEFAAGSGLMPDGPDSLENGMPYESIDGLGDDAWLFGSDTVGNIVVIRGDDVVVVGIVSVAGVTTGPIGDSGVSQTLADAVIALARIASG